jgi:hypothetical protein
MFNEHSRCEILIQNFDVISWKKLYVCESSNLINWEFIELLNNCQVDEEYPVQLEKFTVLESVLSLT